MVDPAKGKDGGGGEKKWGRAAAGETKAGGRAGLSFEKMRMRKGEFDFNNNEKGADAPTSMGSSEEEKEKERRAGVASSGRSKAPPSRHM